MYQNIAEGHDLGPGNLGMTSREFIRVTGGRFADNSQLLNDSTAKELGLLKSFEVGS